MGGRRHVPLVDGHLNESATDSVHFFSSLSDDCDGASRRVCVKFGKGRGREGCSHVIEREISEKMCRKSVKK